MQVRTAIKSLPPQDNIEKQGILSPTEQYLLRTTIPMFQQPLTALQWRSKNISPKCFLLILTFHGIDVSETCEADYKNRSNNDLFNLKVSVFAKV